MDKDIKVTLKVWRQKGPKDKGQFETYQIDKINQSVSFLEMLDILNERLVSEGKEPIVFDHDCREGICGMCSLYVNGHPHGPATGATTCQLYMRRFNSCIQMFFQFFHDWYIFPAKIIRIQDHSLLCIDRSRTSDSNPPALF